MTFFELEQERCRSVDLHTHSTASDGTCTPEELVAWAAAAGIRRMALTDHDTLAGVAQAQVTGRRLGVEVISGIELSADWRGTDVHVLGYGMEPDAEPLRVLLDWVRQERTERNLRMVKRMADDGVDVSMEQLRQRFPDAVLGRPHLARVLMEQGKADSIGEAFRCWLNPGRPYYLPRTKVTLARAVEAIAASGGLPVLAHPMQYGFSPEELREFVAEFAGVATGGMEIYYTGYDRETRAELFAMAQKYGLWITGGSDFHGENKPHIHLGELEVPRSVADCVRKDRREQEL